MMRYHAAGFRNAGAEVVAIADANFAAAQAAATSVAIPQAFADAAELFKLKELDAVSVIVPNKFHAPLALQALKAGKHVFCEKPPALNAKEAKAMADLATKTKKTLMFNFNNRARPESYAIREYIAKGEVGTINSAQAKWQRRAGIPGFGGWFTTKALSGGGPVIDLLHMFDLALYFMDYPEPEWVLAQTFDTFIKENSFKGPWGIKDNPKGTTDVEATAHGFVKFKSGQVVTLQMSWAELVAREEVSVTFQGTKAGGLVRRLFGRDGLDDTSIDACELYTHEHGRPVNRNIIVPADETMGRTRSAANFVATIEGKEAPLNKPSQAVALMKIIDAIYASAKTGKPVKC